MQLGVTARVWVAVVIEAASLGCRLQVPATQAAAPPAATQPPAPDSNPFRLATWCEPGPFYLAAQVPPNMSMSPDDKRPLERTGMDTLFMVAGNVTAPHNVTLLDPDRRYPMDEHLQTHLVLLFDASFARRFGAVANAEIVPSIAKWFAGNPAPSDATQVDGQGVQLDFDCPPRLLGKYADLLHRLGPGLRKRNRLLSATFRPSWLGLPHADEVARAVDFIVLKCFQEAIGDKLADLRPASPSPELGRWVEEAGRMGVKFWVGLSSSGRAGRYDDGGRLVEGFQTLSLIQTWRYSRIASQRVVQAGPRDAPRECMAVLRLSGGARRHGGKAHTPAYTLAYTRPTTSLLSAELESIRRSRPPSCLGATLYGYARGDDDISLSDDEIAVVLGVEKPQLGVSTQVSVRAHPWGLVDAGRPVERSPLSVVLQVDCVGNVPALPCDDSLVLVLKLDRPGIDYIEPHDFDRVETGAIDSLGRFQRTSPARASVLRVYRRTLYPKEVLKFGLQTSADGATEIEGKWTVRGMEAGETHTGVIERRNLQPEGIRK